MKKNTVDQTVVEADQGNCHQAVLATLLDLELSDVPNLILYPQSRWHEVLINFMYSKGWDFEGTVWTEKENHRPLKYEDSICGFFDASVNSRTFPGKTHAVIINLHGIVVHDPNPNKLWLHENVLKTGQLLSWSMYSPMEPAGDNHFLNWHKEMSIKLNSPVPITGERFIKPSTSE